MYLHCIVLVVDDLVESAQNRINDQMSNFITYFWVIFETLQNQFHKLTGRSIHCL